MSSGLWFVTPAYQRFELSDICFRQRRWAIDQLEAHGIRASCVVIADDQNVDLAQKYGFHVVIRNNEHLGRKFNDGYEYALRHDGDWVFPIGSDSWCDPQWLYGQMTPNMDYVLASRYYSMVRRDGQERNVLFVPPRHGVSYIVPVAMYKHINQGRPCRDDISRGCDNSFFTALGPTKVMFREVHTLETVAFQSNVQITDYDKITHKWGIERNSDPYSELRLWYPAELVDAMMAFYERAREGELTYV